MLASGFDRIKLPYLKILTKKEYSPSSLFIGNDKVSSCMTSGEPGSKKNKEKHTKLGYYCISEMQSVSLTHWMY